MKKVKIIKSIFLTFLILTLGTVISNLEVYPQDKGAGVELSLKDVSKIALENSLDVQIAKFDVYISRTSLEKAESIFDSYFTAQASYTHDKRQQASTFVGTDTKEYASSVAIEKKLPTGTTLELDIAGKKNRSDSTFSTLNPYHEASAGLTITQELGRNFFGISDRSDIKITKLDIENSEFTSLDDIEKSLYESQKAYWELVLKNEELIVANDMLKKAVDLYGIYKDKLEIGLVEESEFLAIEALVYTRKSDIEVALLAKETAENKLLFLLNVADFENDIIPKDTLVCSVDKVNLPKALSEAISGRRDYKKVMNDIKKNKIQIIVKENALWPEIDLAASLVRNSIDSDRTTAWTDLSNDGGNEVAVSLTFKVPLENREAKANLRKVNIEKKKVLVQLKKVERLILQELNDKVNKVNTAKNRVHLFDFSVDIHQKKLQKQLERLNFGRSDSDTLIQYEQDLLQARLDLARVLFDYRTGLIELDLAKNTLLDKYWEGQL